MPEAPETYPRRILLAVTGLSPQIVTETLYALAVAREPAWVPSEIQIVTTLRGAEEARLNLLSESPGWFHRISDLGFVAERTAPRGGGAVRRRGCAALSGIGMDSPMGAEPCGHRDSGRARGNRL